jgi:hypothetical protein
MEPCHFGTAPGRPRLRAKPAPLSRQGRTTDSPVSGNDVGDQIILQQRDLIAQAQLSLLQSGELQLVRRGGLVQCRNGAVQVTMFYPQNFEALRDFVGCHHDMVPIMPRDGLTSAPRKNVISSLSISTDETKAANRDLLILP